MSYQERRYKRMIQQVLYGLKRQYSALIAAYKLQDAETDYTTGIKTITKLSEELKAVVVPTKINREILQSISQISANKSMVYGGTFDAGTKTFVIDARDLSVGWEFTDDDWIVYNNQRFEIKNIERLDFHAGWIIVGKMVVGQHAEQIFHLTADSTLILSHVAASVPWTYWAPEQTIGISQGVVSSGSIFNRSAESGPFIGAIPTTEPPPILPGFNLHQHASLIVERPRHPDSVIGIDHSVSVQRIIYQNPHSEISIHDHRQYVVGLQAGVETSIDLEHLTHHNGSAWMRSASSTIGISQEVIVQKVIFKNTENTIGIVDNVVNQKVINRSVTSTIATDQQLDLSVIRELSANSTISLTSTGDRQAILNRQPSSDIAITQDIDKTKVMFDSASSVIGVTDQASSLATDLISAWHLDETSGTRVDSWGGNNLEVVNSVGYVEGVIGNAANFAVASNTQLRAPNDATLQTGDIDFMFTGWIYLHDGPTTYNMWGKWHEGTDDREYMLRMKPSGQLGWSVSRNGTIRTEVTFTTVLSTSTWYFVCVYHDSINNQIGISVDNGSFTTTAHTTGIYISPSNFTLSGDHDHLSPFDGCIDAVHFWKRILSAGEITEMYNGGSGRQLPPFTP